MKRLAGMIARAALLTGALGLAAVARAEAADAGCADGCFLFGPDKPWQLFDDLPGGIEVGGWLQLGYHDEAIPLSQVRGDGLSFNDVPGSLSLHAAWLHAEREATGKDGRFDWGFRFDVLYGTDAQKTQAFGNPPDSSGDPKRWDNSWDHGVYGWAIPQAYLQLARGDLSVIAGHFFTPIGYEGIPAPGNFFFSHSLTNFNSEPFTHTGVLATYDPGEDLALYGGWTLGWDTGFDQFDGGSNFLGGFRYSLTDSVSFKYLATAGNFGQRNAAVGTSGAYAHSVVLDVTFHESWNYVLQTDLMANGPKDHQVSVVQYLFYEINACWKVGARFEWWNDEDDSFYEATFGVNYKPHANVTFRPEVRQDWGGAGSETIFGIDAILSF